MVARRSDPRVRITDARGARGAAHARNVGAAAATGDVLAFCDADDLVAPGWLATLVAALARHDATGGRLDEMVGLTSHHRPPPTPNALPTFLGVPYIVSANLAVPRALFEEVGGFDTELHRCEDIAFSWKLLVAGSTIGYVDGARVAYRPRSGSLAVARQHFAYGLGMAQVLHRYGVPDGRAWRPVRGRALLQPNGQSGGSGGLFAVTRRASLAGGRMVGLLAETIGRDRTSSAA
jgi:glycosyltransferase involved in cell wall biosynthesis